MKKTITIEYEIREDYIMVLKVYGDGSIANLVHILDMAKYMISSQRLSNQ